MENSVFLGGLFWCPRMNMFTVFSICYILYVLAALSVSKGLVQREASFQDLTQLSLHFINNYLIN